jgi:hypothetical protein
MLNFQNYNVPNVIIQHSILCLAKMIHSLPNTFGRTAQEGNGFKYSLQCF